MKIDELLDEINIYNRKLSKGNDSLIISTMYVASHDGDGWGNDYFCDYDPAIYEHVYEY